MLRAMIGTGLVAGALLATGLSQAPAMTTTAAPVKSASYAAGCTGIGNGMSQDYVFTGSGYKAGDTYVVGITTPGGNTFFGVPTADSTGTWTESWLPTSTGYYTANVYTYKSGIMGRWASECGLTVSAW
jgi:hypothetical protein